MVKPKLDWKDGIACKIESLLCLTNPTTINLMHQSSVYVEHNHTTMIGVEFDYYFDVMQKCLKDIRNNPLLVETKTGVNCLEKANQICNLLAVSHLHLNPLQKARLTGIRGGISAALRGKTSTIFYTVK